MSKKDDAQVIREVSDSIDEAVEKLRRTERIVIVALVAILLVGLGLLVYGAITRIWEILVPGAFVQLTIVFPVRRLVRLREDEMRLRILPQLMRLADSKEAKIFAAKLVARLIEQVGSNDKHDPANTPEDSANPP